MLIFLGILVGTTVLPEEPETTEELVIDETTQGPEEPETTQEPEEETTTEEEKTTTTALGLNCGVNSLLPESVFIFGK